MRLPSLNALRAFEAAARHESFTRAANELFVTEGAVSRHVKLLEEDLGVQLFRRLPRSLKLTEAGRKFLPVLTDAFESIASAARQAQGSKRELKVICPPTFSIRWLLPRLQQFKSKFPEIQLRLTTAPYNWEIFFGGDFDLGFDCGSGYSERPDGIEAVLVLQSIMTPVCAPRVLETASLIKPSDLAAHNLLHTTPDRHDWEIWLKTFKVEGVDGNLGELFPSADMAYRAAALGQGVAVGDLVVLRDEIESGELILPFKDYEVRVPTEAYHLFGAASSWNDPDVRTFRTWVLETAATGNAK